MSDEQLSPEELQAVIKAVDAIDQIGSFGQMMQENPGIIAILCWLLGFLLREIIIFSNIFADWLRKFLRVNGVRNGRRKDNRKNDC